MLTNTPRRWARTLVLASLLCSCASRTVHQRSIAVADWGNSKSSSLDLEFSHSRHVFVRASVNGYETQVLIDSGAGITVIDKAFFATLGLESTGHVRVMGVGGTAPASYVSKLRLKLGTFELREVTALVTDLSQIEAHVAHKIPVILGNALFENAVVEIDYPKGRLICHRPELFSYAGSGTRNELVDLGSRTRYLRCQVEGLAPALFQVDTGSGNTLDLFAGYTKTNRLLVDRKPKSKKYGGGVGGFRTVVVATIASLVFCGHNLLAIPMSFPPAIGAFARTSHAGNLGAGILSRFHLWFDYRHNLLYVEPGPELKLPFKRDRIGITTSVKKDKLLVEFVSPNSPAQRAGIKAGMQITAINAMRVADAKQAWAQLRSLSQSTIGSIVELRSKKAVRYRVQLADFY